MGKSSSAPQAPDFSGLINAANAQSARYAELMDEQLQFSKDAYAHQLPYTDKIQEIQLDTAQDAAEFAKGQRAQYENLYRPLAEEFVGAARDYTSEDKMARARGTAMATVGAQFDTAGEAAKRSLESFGIDPTATRYAGLDIGARTAKAAATAAAANKSDTDRELTGLGLQSQAINMGNGLPGQVVASQGVGTAAGAAGVGAGNSTYGSFAPALGNPTAWGGLSSNALGQAGSFTNMGYQGQLGQYQANQQNSSGIGSILGIGASLAGKYFGFEEGGLVPEEADGSIPMAGGVVPPGMSPSGGAMTDDVPAQVGPGPAIGGGGGPPEARINVNEFVLPEDVTMWMGEEKLQKMIMKAREDKAKAVAQPERRPAVGGSPPPVQAGALPIRPQPQMGVGA